MCFFNQGCGSFLFLVFLLNGVESSLKMCVICSCLTLSRNIHSASHSKLYIACFLFPKRGRKKSENGQYFIFVPLAIVLSSAVAHLLIVIIFNKMITSSEICQEKH